MANQPVRIGIIGAGGIVKSRHLPGLKKIEGVELVAVCNRSETSGQAVATEWGFTGGKSRQAVMTDWRKLAEREDIDAVLIGTWPYMHKEMSVAALAAGKHVFCQARMAMDWSQAVEMYRAAKAHPKQVNMICPPPHRMPWEPAIKKLLADRALGDIYEVRIASISDANADPAKLTWREMVEYSGLQALQVGIWSETLIAWLGEYKTFTARTAILVPTKTGPDGQSYTVRIPQVVKVHGRLVNNALVSEHHTGMAHHSHVNAIEVFGSAGTLRVDASKSIKFGKAGRPLEDYPVPANLLRDWQVESDFVDAVRAAMGGQSWKVSPDFSEGLLYMRTVQAIADAARDHRTVDVTKEYPLPQ